MEFNSPLDKGIEEFVEIMVAAGVETYESCEGGEGHAFPEPTIRFHGDYGAGFLALAVAFQHAMPVKSLRRVWDVLDGELVGPTWEMVFFRQNLRNSVLKPERRSRNFYDKDL